MHARDLAQVARVLRRYKELSAAEQALVKSRVAQRLNALISLEVVRVTIAHQGEREAVKRLPDKQQATRRLAELDSKIRREAEAHVYQQLGKLLAVPLKTSDNRSAVAFARIGETGIEVAKDAGEIDRPIATLVAGEMVEVAPRQLATVVTEKGVPVAPPH
jgi:hypothetical protein